MFIWAPFKRALLTERQAAAQSTRTKAAKETDRPAHTPPSARAGRLPWRSNELDRPAKRKLRTAARKALAYLRSANLLE